MNPDSAESKPVPTVGYDDPRWANPHSATVFPKNTHPWETGMDNSPAWDEPLQAVPPTQRPYVR